MKKEVSHVTDMGVLPAVGPVKSKAGRKLLGRERLNITLPIGLKAAAFGVAGQSGDSISAYIAGLIRADLEKRGHNPDV